MTVVSPRDVSIGHHAAEPISVNREELYRLVWSVPGSTLAPRFGVSDVYLGHVCKALGVPRPAPGYWARLRARKAAEVPPLPSPEPGHPTLWLRGRNAQTPIKSFYNDLTPSSNRDLVSAAAAILEPAKPAPDGVYLTSRTSRMIDLSTSRSGLSRALAYAEALFVALEAHRHRVTVATSNLLFRAQIDIWEHPPVHDIQRSRLLQPSHPTIVVVNNRAVGLAIIEMIEEIEMVYVGDGRFVPKSETVKRGSSKIVGLTWTERKPRATGRLKLVAYSPYRLTPWRREWVERPDTNLISSVEETISDIEAVVAQLPVDGGQAR